ncbi:MAG: helix-turn-helix transcriptional regulator [Deltaproteobacteria bacterium]|nr:helix-turn-helix transcriptional regulator [Deltaproteobacteria bacterium]
MKRDVLTPLNDSKLEQAFGRVLQELRAERQISQEELGFRSGYHRTYISLLERGKKNPSLQTVFQLAIALKVEPTEILGRVQKHLSNPSK